MPPQIEEDVLWLDVPVHYALRVQVGHSDADLNEVELGIRLRESPQFT